MFVLLRCVSLRVNNIHLRDFTGLHGFDYNFETKWLALMFTSIYSLHDNLVSRNRRTLRYFKWNRKPCIDFQGIFSGATAGSFDLNSRKTGVNNCRSLPWKCKDSSKSDQQAFFTESFNAVKNLLFLCLPWCGLKLRNEKTENIFSFLKKTLK